MWDGELRGKVCGRGCEEGRRGECVGWGVERARCVGGDVRRGGEGSVGWGVEGARCVGGDVRRGGVGSVWERVAKRWCVWEGRGGGGSEHVCMSLYLWVCGCDSSGKEGKTICQIPNSK